MAVKWICKWCIVTKERLNSIIDGYASNSSAVTGIEKCNGKIESYKNTGMNIQSNMFHNSQ